MKSVIIDTIHRNKPASKATGLSIAILPKYVANAMIKRQINIITIGIAKIPFLGLIPALY